MKKFFLGAFALTAIVFCSALILLGLQYIPTSKALSTAASTPRNVVHKIVVEADGKAIGSGSGVMIAPLLMLTAAHVANAGPALSIEGTKAPVRVLRVDPKADLALLMVAVNCPCASLAMNPPSVDQKVVAVGFPYNHVINAQILTEGRIQGSMVDGATVVTSPVARGNSGGGLFVREHGRYKLVGIVTSVVSEGFGGSVHHLVAGASLEQMKTFLDNRSPAELDSVQPGTTE